LEDLLGRPQVSLDLARIRSMVVDRTVLITGAGGSIGSELSRQLAALGPRRLVLLDLSEFNLYLVDRLLGHQAPHVDRAVLIGSVRDRSTIERIFREEKPDIVFHAAALKHVPLLESNVCEGVLTNVEGTRIVADAAIAAGAKAMVLISTDKAINPSSVMGAGKRAAECYCQALDATRSSTRLITVRFGNVLGSTGSVVPLFEQQIRDGGPLTVTHPEMQRYFMTVREATELVLQAAAHGLAHPEETGRIHVLDMGKPIRIVDLARTMVALAGLKPDEIEIQYVGMRPCEKLFEEYFGGEEDTVASTTAGVLLASPRRADRVRLVALLDRLSAGAMAGDEPQVRELLDLIVRGSGPPALELDHAIPARVAPAMADRP
jgi:O-antigen biosynthesis protein WbqV